MIYKAVKKMLVDSFVYEAYTGETDRNHQPIYSTPININECRIDRKTTYGMTGSTETKRSIATIYVYGDKHKFAEESRIAFDGKAHTVVEVRENKHPFNNEVISYEIEVL